MTTEDIKKSFFEWLDAMNKRDLDEIDKAIDKWYSPDFVLHDPDMPGLGKGPEVMKNLSRGILADLPGVQAKVDQVLWEGDRMACRVLWTGTNEKTGEPIHIEVMGFCRFSGDKIVEEWELVVPVKTPVEA